MSKILSKEAIDHIVARRAAEPVEGRVLKMGRGWWVKSLEDVSPNHLLPGKCRTKRAAIEYAELNAEAVISRRGLRELVASYRKDEGSAA